MSQPCRPPALAAILLGISLSGCTPPPPAAQPAPAAGVSYGVIAAARAAGARPADARANVLRAVGFQAAGSGSGAAGAVEFIVRSDDGGTVSVMQYNQESLRPGDRVVIARFPRTRIALAPAPN